MGKREVLAKVRNLFAEPNKCASVRDYRMKRDLMWRALLLGFECGKLGLWPSVVKIGEEEGYFNE